ncbi:DNA-3-methyladenine glycosylase I [Actinomycetaceae bacterium L2_0104]
MGERKAALSAESTGNGLVQGPDGLLRPTWANRDELVRDYYDLEWGKPLTDERDIFESLSLEVFQAGLSWLTILRKRPGLRAAFANFDPDRVAAFSEEGIARLLGDSSIVRNRRKIVATITNAQATVRLREKMGLPGLVWSFEPSGPPWPGNATRLPTRSPESIALAGALRAEGFTMVGPTSVYALMCAIGIIRKPMMQSHREVGVGGPKE